MSKLKKSLPRVRITGGQMMDRRPNSTDVGPQHSLKGATGVVASEPFETIDPDTGKKRMDVAVGIDEGPRPGIYTVPVSKIEQVVGKSPKTSVSGTGPGVRTKGLVRSTTTYKNGFAVTTEHYDDGRVVTTKRPI